MANVTPQAIELYNTLEDITNNTSTLIETLGSNLKSLCHCMPEYVLNVFIDTYSEKIIKPWEELISRVEALDGMDAPDAADNIADVATDVHDFIDSTLPSEIYVINTGLRPYVSIIPWAKVVV